MVYLSTEADRPNRRPPKTNPTRPKVVSDGSFIRPPNVSESGVGWA